MWIWAFNHVMFLYLQFLSLFHLVFSLSSFSPQSCSFSYSLRSIVMGSPIHSYSHHTTRDYIAIIMFTLQG